MLYKSPIEKTPLAIIALVICMGLLSFMVMTISIVYIPDKKEIERLEDNFRKTCVELNGVAVKNSQNEIICLGVMK